MRPGGRYAIRDLPFDLVAGIALAAIAVPSQMATAHLAGYPPVQGFAAFAAGSVGFALLGANRYLVICADSTIAPIFAGGLAHLAATGTHAYFVLAASFALMVGGILFCTGLFRLGWLANLVSVPVTAGFLAGIAIHIIISQLPFLLGVAPPKGDLLQQVSEIVNHLGETSVLTLVLGLLVFGATVCAEWINPRIPGALIGIVAATAAVFWFQLEREGVAVLGPVSGELPRFHIPSIAYRELVEVMPLAFVVAAVVMVQSAATTRAFPGAGGTSASINRDFTGIGAANLISGLFGTFAVDASPPLTETVAESGGHRNMCEEHGAVNGKHENKRGGGKPGEFAATAPRTARISRRRTSLIATNIRCLQVRFRRIPPHLHDICRDYAAAGRNRRCDWHRVVLLHGM